MRVKYRLLKLMLVPAVATAMLAGACSEQGTPTDRLVAPEQPDLARGGNTKIRRLSLTNPAPMHVEANVSERGGILQAEQYFLLVPAGAVKGQTHFTMDVGTDGVVSLEATQTRNGVKVDVGATGFRKPLTLALYYGNSDEAIANASALKVAQLLDNGALLPVKSVVNTTYKVVYGELQHFSIYLLGSPRDDDE